MAARRRGGEREVRQQALFGLGAALVLLGLGIPVADQERIFEKLVEQMGGRLGVRSTPGTGSTFSVELPLAE